ncbi:unnamed protein product [Ostreobium quekettii]|uniref:Uncharacterized protein n=1 Tax=Ostreobium quekettii TaxID=121088 RepID=A0A8S1JGF2_9CHLO|nr:unnamed protein product [Ostreobium quekettii]
MSVGWGGATVAKESWRTSPSVEAYRSPSRASSRTASTRVASKLFMALSGGEVVPARAGRGRGDWPWAVLPTPRLTDSVPLGLRVTGKAGALRWAGNYDNCCALVELERWRTRLRNSSPIVDQMAVRNAEGLRGLTQTCLLECAPRACGLPCIPERQRGAAHVCREQLDGMTDPPDDLMDGLQLTIDFLAKVHSEASRSAQQLQDIVQEQQGIIRELGTRAAGKLQGGRSQNNKVDSASDTGMLECDEDQNDRLQQILQHAQSIRQMSLTDGDSTVG